jgi:hypothetical protein
MLECLTLGEPDDGDIHARRQGATVEQTAYTVTSGPTMKSLPLLSEPAVAVHPNPLNAGADARS